MTDNSTTKALVLAATEEPASQVLQEAMKNRQAILSALLEAWKRVTEGKLTIALFGVGGAGKTTTQMLLSEGISASSKNTTYLPTTKAKKKNLQDKLLTAVWDTAGQEDFRAATWSEALSSLQNSSRAVIINVTSYGYNATGDVTFEDIKRAVKKTKKDEAIEAYFKSERKKELALLAQLQPELNQVKGHINFLTIMNKQDLWWNSRAKVAKHYVSGPYMSRLKQIRDQHGARNFTYAFRPVALCPVNLVTKEGIQLAQTSGGYDTVVREFHFTNLLRTLRELVG